MYKISGIEDSIKSFADKPVYSLRKEIYKKVIKPGEEKKEEGVGSRLVRAGLVGLATAGTLHYLPKLLHRKSLPLGYLIPGSLSAATAGYFFPEHRNEIIDYHQHKNDKLLKENLDKLHGSERNIYNRSKEVSGSIKNTIEMSKQSSIMPFLGKAIGGVAKAGWKTGGAFARGLLPVSKTAPLGSRVMGKVSKGIAIGGLGYGGYKGYQAVTRPVSESNYTTFLRNNILSGNIKADEITDRDKTQINNLGMR
jgi:hypothetical protein